jgi:hypothetical protein
MLVQFAREIAVSQQSIQKLAALIAMLIDGIWLFGSNK